jgi:hypothetical protein
MTPGAGRDQLPDSGLSASRRLARRTLGRHGNERQRKPGVPGRQVLVTSVELLGQRQRRSSDLGRRRFRGLDHLVADVGKAFVEHVPGHAHVEQLGGHEAERHDQQHGHEPEEHVRQNQLLPDPPQEAAAVPPNRHHRQPDDGHDPRQAHDSPEHDEQERQLDKHADAKEDQEQDGRQEEEPARKRTEVSDNGDGGCRHGTRQIAMRMITD